MQRRILVEMIDSACIETARTTDDTVNDVALRQEEFRQVTSILDDETRERGTDVALVHLSSDASDQCDFTSVGSIARCVRLLSGHI